MTNFMSAVYKMRFLDELAEKKTPIHDLHALAKLLVTVAYIIAVISFGKYSIVCMIPFVVFPLVIFGLAEIPFWPILKRALWTLPFIIGVGLFNPLFDRDTVISIWAIPISGGWISFIALMIKGILTVLAGLLLISTTGIENIGSALRKIGVPKIFVMQFVLTYRYITVLLESVGNVWNAYRLRAPMEKGIHYKIWGSLVGQLLIRSFDRAQRIYDAMTIRGFVGEYHTGKEKRLHLKDYCYSIGWMIFFVVARGINIPLLIGNSVTGVIK